MHFRLFIPDAQGVGERSPEPLADVGMSHLAEGFVSIVSKVEGVAGRIYHWPAAGDQQVIPVSKPLTWERALPFQGLEAGRYSVGLCHDSLPREKELRMALPITGRIVPLGYEQWIIPSVELLPVQLVMTATGVAIERISRHQNRTLDARAWIQKCEGFIHRLREGKSGNSDEWMWSWERAWHFAYDGLVINYRITPEVVNHLHLFCSDTLHPLILAAVGAIDSEEAEET